MRHERLIAAVGACALAAGAMAQAGVELRVVERNGRTQAGPGNAVLDFAVQARVTGGGSLGDFSFDVRIDGEAESSGVLNRGRISNADGTYTGLPASVNSAAGLGGLAKTYTYIAFINPNFNGLINTSGGTFTHAPGNQEIGLIVGSATAFSLLNTPGVDAWDGDAMSVGNSSGDGQPDGWNAAHPWTSADGGGAMPPAPVSGDMADLEETTAATYFAKGAFVDVYRFRYTVTDLSPRVLRVRLANASAATFVHLGFGYGWSTMDAGGSVTPAVAGLDVAVVGSTPLGMCCSAGGTCGMAVASDCVGDWSASGTCGPHVCPGACCVGTSCSRVDDFTCIVTMHGRYQGVGTACGTSANPTMCCPANVDGVGGVTVSDIFVFLNSWLAGEARADFNGDMAVDTFDVFAFVQAWFAGC